MKTKLITLFLILIFLSCGEQTNKNKLEKSEKSISLEKAWHILSTDEWVKNKGLSNVESVIFDDVNQLFYASNGIEYGLGTNGFISKISENGSLQELKWVDQLNRPTGMAIHDSLLYVADVNALVVIDIIKGEVVEKFLEPISNSGLNDVSVSDDGTVYVSASAIHSVMKLNDDKLELWSQDQEQLKWANGLIANDDQVFVAGLKLSKIDVDSKKVTKVVLNASVEDFDGIVSDGLGGYFLTTVGQGNRGLFHLTENNIIIKLMEEINYFGDLEFIQDSKKIYIPRGNKITNEYFISVLTVE